MALDEKPDLVVLDMGMPGLNGISACVAFDASGNLYAATSGSVEKNAPDGTVNNFATEFLGASGLAFGASGDFYVADQANN